MPLQAANCHTSHQCQGKFYNEIQNVFGTFEVTWVHTHVHTHEHLPIRMSLEQKMCNLINTHCSTKSFIKTVLLTEPCFEDNNKTPLCFVAFTPLPGEISPALLCKSWSGESLPFLMPTQPSLGSLWDLVETTLVEVCRGVRLRCSCPQLTWSQQHWSQLALPGPHPMFLPFLG